MRNIVPLTSQALAVALLLGSPVAGLAQSLLRKNAHDVPATVVLVDELQYPDAAAVVLRRTQESPADVLVLPRSTASADLLAAAAFVLLQARRLSGDVPQEPAVFRVATAKSRRGLQRRALPTARRILKELRRQETTLIEGVGRVQATTVWFRPAASVQQ